MPHVQAWRMGHHMDETIFIKGNSNKLVLISWQSKRLVRVTKSLLAFVVLSLEEATNASFLMSSFIQEIFNMSALPIIYCYSNNRSLADTRKTTRVISNRRLDWWGQDPDWWWWGRSILDWCVGKAGGCCFNQEENFYSNVNEGTPSSTFGGWSQRRAGMLVIYLFLYRLLELAAHSLKVSQTS